MTTIEIRPSVVSIPAPDDPRRKLYFFRLTPGLRMPIQVTCTNCQKVIKAPDNLAGKRVKCPQCSTVLSIPGNASAGTAAQRPPATKPRSTTPPGSPTPQPGKSPTRGPQGANPAVPPQPAHPGMGAAPGRPGAPTGFGGVADLIDEEINRQVNKKIKEEDDEIRRQIQEKAWNELMAPKMKALEMQKKGLSAAIQRKISVGQVLSRSWRVFSADSGTIIGMTLLAFLIEAGVGALLIAPLAIFGVIALVATMTTRSVPAEVAAFIAQSLIFFAAVVLEFTLGVAANAWMLAGMARYLLRRIKGQTAEFTDLFRGGPDFFSMWGAKIAFGLIASVPSLHTVIALLVFFGMVLAGVVQDHPDLSQSVLAIASPAVALEAESDLVRWCALGSGLLSLGLRIAISLYLLRICFYPWIIVDGGGKGTGAFAVSAGLTTGNMWKLLGLVLIWSSIATSGLCLFCLGFIGFAVPFGMVVWGVTYAEMVGIEEPLPGQVETPA